MKQTIYFIILVLLIVAIGVGGYFVYRNFDTILSWFKDDEQIQEKHENEQQENENQLEYNFSEEQKAIILKNVKSITAGGTNDEILKIINEPVNKIIIITKGINSHGNPVITLFSYQLKENSPKVNEEYIVNLVQDETVQKECGVYYPVKDCASEYYQENQESNYRIGKYTSSIDNLWLSVTSVYKTEKYSYKLSALLLESNNVLIVRSFTEYNTETDSREIIISNYLNAFKAKEA